MQVVTSAVNHVVGFGFRTETSGIAKSVTSGVVRQDRHVCVRTSSMRLRFQLGALPPQKIMYVAALHLSRPDQLERDVLSRSSRNMSWNASRPHQQFRLNPSRSFLQCLFFVVSSCSVLLPLALHDFYSVSDVCPVITMFITHSPTFSSFPTFLRIRQLL